MLLSWTDVFLGTVFVTDLTLHYRHCLGNGNALPGVDVLLLCYDYAKSMLALLLMSMLLQWHASGMHNGNTSRGSN